MQLSILNACKNILVVVQVMDRPLCETVLRALNFEWGNPSCCVPVHHALIGDCSFQSAKNNLQGDDKKDEKYWNRYRQEKMCDVCSALHKAGWHKTSRIECKYQFGVVTTRRFATSHYTIIYACKDDKKRRFYLYSRFDKDETKDRRSLHYADKEDDGSCRTSTGVNGSRHLSNCQAPWQKRCWRIPALPAITSWTRLQVQNRQAFVPFRREENSQDSR